MGQLGTGMAQGAYPYTIDSALGVMFHRRVSGGNVCRKCVQNVTGSIAARAGLVIQRLDKL